MLLSALTKEDVLTGLKLCFVQGVISYLNQAQMPIRDLDFHKVFEFVEMQGKMVDETKVKQGILKGLDKAQTRVCLELESYKDSLVIWDYAIQPSAGYTVTKGFQVICRDGNWSTLLINLEQRHIKSEGQLVLQCDSGQLACVTTQEFLDQILSNFKGVAKETVTGVWEVQVKAEVKNNFLTIQGFDIKTVSVGSQTLLQAKALVRKSFQAGKIEGSCLSTTDGIKVELALANLKCSSDSDRALQAGFLSVIGRFNQNRSIFKETSQICEPLEWRVNAYKECEQIIKMITRVDCILAKK